MIEYNKISYERNKIPVEWLSKPPNQNEIPSGVFVIRCDAAWKNGITGICTIVETHNKKYKPTTYYRRTEGSIHAELTAIHLALKRLNGLQQNIKKCIIYTDCVYALNFLFGEWTPQKDFIKDIMEKINIELENFRARNVELIALHTKTRNIRTVDKTAHKARKKAESRKQEQIKKRVEKLEKAIVGGRDYQISQRNGSYFAIPRENGFPPGYKVSLDPLNCECPWWKHNWSSKPPSAVKARALPCKHMCALAEHQKLSIYDIFSHQIKNKS